MAAAAAAWIDQLGLTWRSIDELCSGLTDAEWKAPTGCPGWSVQDNLSHLVDYEASALGRPRPDHEPLTLDHTKNALGESNEVGVDARRTWTGERVLDVACGTGRLLRQIAVAHPQMRLCGLDLSPYYVQEARALLSDHADASFVVGNATIVPGRGDANGPAPMEAAHPRTSRGTMARCPAFPFPH